nr:uncharacterized protein LOC102452183 [Pelodiscus sinensis]|eukprot:XP_014430505.1 uncharacterized protein LOC102452183 [Pelodiscus sinensis]
MALGGDGEGEDNERDDELIPKIVLEGMIAVPTKAQRKTHHPCTSSPGSDRAAFLPGPSISPQRRRSHYHEYSPARRYYRSPRRSITPPHYHRSYYSRSPYRYSYRSCSPRSPTRSRYYRHRSTLSYSPQYSHRPSRHRSLHSERSRSISRRSPLSPSRQQIYSPTTQGSIPPAQRPPAPTGDASTTSVPQDDTTQSPVAEHQSVASPTDVASSSPDDAVFNDEPPLADDYKQFHELFTRVADSQNLRTSGAPPKHHPLLRNLQHSSKSKLALPFDAAILEVANDIWQTPASMPPTNKRTDRKYFIDAKDAEFLFTHPVPNSIVVDAAQQKARSAQARNSIADKEAKRLDLLGRKVYSSATATLRMANYSAHLANHDFDNYSKLVPLIQHLPHSQREVLKAIVQEGYTVARNALQISLDIADSASRTTATSIVMRRDSWLHLASVPKDLHPKVEDLPFDRASLFAQNTDQVFHSGKDSRNTLRTLGMYTPPFRRRRAWPYNRQRPPPSSASYYTNQRFRPYDQHRQRQRPQRRRQQPNKANNQQQSRQQV